jgi:hypothetical protein
MPPGQAAFGEDRMVRLQDWWSCHIRAASLRPPCSSDLLEQSVGSHANLRGTPDALLAFSNYYTTKISSPPEGRVEGSRSGSGGVSLKIT